MKANIQGKSYLPKEGQVLRADDDYLYVYKEGQYHNMAEDEINTGMMLYDLNKQGYSQIPPYSDEELVDVVNLINTYAEDYRAKYYMFLCKEMSYYTVFVKEFLEPEFSNLGTAVIECISNVGTIHGSELNHELGSIELWVKTEEDMFCMILFPYDHGIVTIGG